MLLNYLAVVGVVTLLPAFTQGSPADDLFNLRLVNKYLREELETKCADFMNNANAVGKRATADEINLAVQKKINAELTAILTKCTATTVPTPAPTKPTSGPCVDSSTLLLDEAWRSYTAPTRAKPVAGKEACDAGLSHGKTWFRFPMGTRILTSCPSPYSCGATYSYWVDGKLPTRAGEMTTVKLRGRLGRDCYWRLADMTAQRCSDEPTDIVYRLDGEIRCSTNDGGAICVNNIKAI